VRTEQPEAGGDAMRELKVGCGKPTCAKMGEKEQTELPGEEPKSSKEVPMSVVRVGRKAPDFEAPA